MIQYNKGIDEYRNFLLTEDYFDDMNLGKTEAIMCQGNGYMCMRGYAEEDYTKKTANTFIAGTFNVPAENEVTELPNTADCFSMEIQIDGERFFLTKDNVEAYDKTLNIKTGELVRTFQYVTKDNKIAFRMRRFVSAHNIHLAAQNIEITPLEKGCHVKIISGIDSKPTNSGDMHFIDATRRFFEKRYIYTKLVTTQSKIAFYINASHRIFLDGVEDESLPKPLMGRKEAFQEYQYDLQKDATLSINKYITYYTSIDNEKNKCENPEESYLILKEWMKQSYEDLLCQSSETLRVKLWDDSHIEIDSINENDQLAINYCQYQMYVMTPAHDNRMNIGAKGLSGEGYKGHTFWDTEVFLLPKFIFQEPMTAKSLLIYRYHGLEGAKRKAKENGYEGAMYPWEAANPEDGEVTPVYGGIDVYTGERELIKTGLYEIHITADVAFGVYSYFNATQDEAFMEEYGYEILFETAKFWNSRLEKSQNDEYLHINGIIGPDEYCEDVDDNAYTNYLAKWNMEYALEVIEKLKEEKPELLKSLNEKTKIEEYVESIQSQVNKVYLSNPGDDLIIDQDTTYRNLEEIDLTKYKTAGKVATIMADYNLEQISELKVSKQADIMVLFLLFGEKWNDEIKKANFRYYEPFCLHDSSLSFSTYSVLANDIGATEYSYELFQKAATIDIGQAMNACDAGVHAASYGGVWQCIIMGFAGLRMIDRRLHINPRLPKEISRIKFGVFYKGQRLEIEVKNGAVNIENTGNKVVSVIVDGKEIEV